MTISRLNEKPSLYILISISNLGINLLLQLYFIVIKNYDFGYVFLAKTIAPAVIFIIFIPYVIKNIFAKINFEDVKSILKFSFPLMLAALLSIMLNTFDRFILTYFVSKEEIAIYTTGYSIGSMTNAFILAPFTLAFNMIFWKKIEEVNFRRFMTKSSTYLFFSMIIISLIITYFLPYAIRIFVRNEALWSAENVIPFILFANCFVALFIFPSHDFYYRKTTSKILIIIAICLIFNFIANVIFINYFGIYASAVITVLSFILMISLGYLITKKYSFTKFESRKIILLSVMFVIFASYVYAVSISNVYLDVIIKLLLIFLFLIILHKVNFFEPIETERIRGFFNKYLFSKLR
jgi:O-antigen/teichoic acid export membrane protein